MVLQNNQNLIEMTSNIFIIIAFGVGFKCPRKIHLNTQCRGGQILPTIAEVEPKFSPRLRPCEVIRPNIAGSKKLFSSNQMLPVLEHTVAHSILALLPHCVFKWILRGHFKPTTNATI